MLSPINDKKGKPTVEDHVRILETHLLEKLKEKAPYSTLSAINDECTKIVAAINDRRFEKEPATRKQLFGKYDKPHMRPLPGGKYVPCEYKSVLRVPDNYHIEFDGHYYSVFYTQHGKPAILKATISEIRICDANNRLLCCHRREYNPYPKYITDESHMPPEHQYYKEVNSKNGSYYRSWAKAFGPSMTALIGAVLQSFEFEEQSYNSCSGILHACDSYPKSYGEAAAQQCVQMKSMNYSAFRKALRRIVCGSLSQDSSGLPESENIRGRDHWA